MFRKFLTILFVLLCYSSAYAEPLKIGLIVPLSGTGASIGHYVKKGVELSVDKAKENGAEIELFVEDDGWEIPKSLSTAQRLISLHKVHALLVVGSAVGNAVASIAERNKVVMIAIGASDYKIAKDKLFSFTHWVTPETESKLLIDEIVRRDYKNVGIIVTEQEGAIAIFDAVKSEVKKQKVHDRFKFEKHFLPNQLDFKTVLLKIKEKKLDSIVLCLFSDDLVSFTKQAKALNVDIPFIGVEMFEDEHTVKASEGALFGHWYVNADEASGDFTAAYRTAYNEHPGWAAANSFDAVSLVLEAHNKNSDSTQKMASYLSSIKDFKGAAGVYSATGDNRFTLPAAVKVVMEDGFKKLH